MSFWEAVGERLGYAIGGVIFGPAVMLAQRRRKTRRRALASWLVPSSYTRLRANEGAVRWLVVDRREDELSFSIEVELVPTDEGYARVTVLYERLPDSVVARFEQDVERERIASWRSVVVRPELLEVEADAPMSADEWDVLVRGATSIAAWLARRNRAGYR